MDTNEPTLESLLDQVPIRDSVFEALGCTGVFLLRYVLRGIERPKVPPLPEFVLEGDLNTIEWALAQHKKVEKPAFRSPMHANYTNAFHRACEIAASRCRQDILKVLLPRDKCRASYAAACAAAREGHFGIVKWLHKTNRIAPTLPLGMSSHCNIDNFVKHLQEFGRCDENTHAGCKCTLPGEMVAASVASAGDLCALKWCLEQGYHVSAKAKHAAAEHGRVHLLKWLRGVSGLNRTVQHAARHVHTLEYLHNLHLVDEEAFTSAASKGLTELMDWLLANGFHPRSKAIREAAKAGQKGAIEWLLNNGALWTADTVACAAQHGLDMVLWVMVRGAAWAPEACIVASKYGHDDVVKYALRNKLPFHHAECVRIRVKRNKGPQ
jgi:hypothetical protein